MGRPSQTLLRGATLLTQDPARSAPLRADLLVEGDRIAAIGPVSPGRLQPDCETIELAGKLVLPGLINTHVHTSQQLARGLADDVDLLTWLRERTWPFESALTPDDSYFSTLACGIELIRSGVTTFAEAGGWHVDGMGAAVERLGLRAVLSQSAMDLAEGLPAGWSNTPQALIDLQRRQHERWHGAADGRLRHWFGLRTVFNCSDELMRRTKAEADRLGIGIHMHVAEIPGEIAFMRARSGAGTVEHLHRLGLLDRNLLAVHAVWLTERELDLFALHDVKVSHCPAAAMRVLGFAFVPEMLDRGITVGLGTDGAPSNNRMDLIDEMHLTALIHKGRRLDPAVIPAQAVLRMATLDGARALLMGDEIGSLSVGKKADLIVIDPRDAATLPVHDPVSAMVYSMHSHNVEASMCNGRWLMRGRKVLTVDEDEIVGAIQQRAEAIRARAGIHPLLTETLTETT
jgi:5-methylthioadenosine/S-adenosylhomocysteine deaminase